MHKISPLFLCNLGDYLQPAALTLSHVSRAPLSRPAFLSPPSLCLSTAFQGFTMLL